MKSSWAGLLTQYFMGQVKIMKCSINSLIF